MRAGWIEKRRGLRNVTQMHLARQGQVTEEMARVAARERLEPVKADRADAPAERVNQK